MRACLTYVGKDHKEALHLCLAHSFEEKATHLPGAVNSGDSRLREH